MQVCFRKYPEIYGAELSDDELAEDAVDGAGQAPTPEEYQVLRDEAQVSAAKEGTPDATLPSDVTPVESSIPAKWEDATAANDEVANKDTEKESKPEVKDVKEELKPEEKDAKKESRPEGEKSE